MASAKSARQKTLIRNCSQGERRAFHKKFSQVPEDDVGGLTFSAIRRSKISAHFAYAYRKTGLLITVENERKASGEDLKRWHAALVEYFDREREGKVGAVSRLLH